MTGLQRRGDLLDRLAKVCELIEQYQATLGLLERERLALQIKLRTVGWKPFSPVGRGS